MPSGRSSTRDPKSRLIRSTTVLSHCRSAAGACSSRIRLARIGAMRSAAQPAGAFLERGEVEQPQAGAVGLMAGYALVVIDAVAAAVQDELAPEHLDRARVMRGVAVGEVDAAVDQGAGEAHLIRVYAVSPVRSPVDGDHRDVTGPPGRPHLADEIAGGRRRQVGAAG